MAILTAVLLVHPTQTMHTTAFKCSHHLNTVLKQEFKNNTYNFCEYIPENTLVLVYAKYMIQIHLKLKCFCADTSLHMQPFDDSYSYKKFFNGKRKSYALPSLVSFVTSFLEVKCLKYKAVNVLKDHI
jgi:hypothetical protein